MSGFKDYFDLNNKLEGLKVHNDFVNTRLFNKNQFKTIGAISFALFLIIKYSSDFYFKKDIIIPNLKFRFNSFNYNVKNFEKILKDFESLINIGADTKSKQAFIKNCNKFIHKIIYQRRNGLNESKDENLNEIFSTLNKLLTSDINILPKVLPLYELLFDYFDNLNIESNKVFLNVINENLLMFDYFILTDLNGFYKIKKIIKIVLKGDQYKNTEIKDKIDKIK